MVDPLEIDGSNTTPQTKTALPTLDAINIVAGIAAALFGISEGSLIMTILGITVTPAAAYALYVGREHNKSVGKC
jgi:hypothetical protein